MSYLNDNCEKAASGLNWEYEMESIILEIIGDADEILEEKLLELLIPRPELQTLLASFAEFIQKIPELQKKHGKSKHDFSRNTIRDELKILLYDIATGVFDRFREIRGQQRLERVTINDANNCSHVFIRRITDDYNLR